MTPADQTACARWMGERGILSAANFREGFIAGLAHAREQAATQLEKQADAEIENGSFCCLTMAAVLRDQAAKIRSGE